MVAFAWALLDGYNDRLLPLQSVPRHYAVCRRTSSAQTDSTFVLCLLVVFIGIPRFGAPNREWIQRTLSPRCGLVISPPPPIAIPLSEYELLALSNTQACSVHGEQTKRESTRQMRSILLVLPSCRALPEALLASRMAYAATRN